MRKFAILSVVLVLGTVVGPMAAIAQKQDEVTTKTETSEKPIPFDVKYVFNRDLGPGRVKKVTDGVDGKIITTVTSYIQDGKVIKTESKDERVEPKSAVFYMGKTGFSGASRGSYTRAKVMSVEATAYLPHDGSSTGRTATGRKAAYGIIATDPKVIPLGTLVFVEGYGLALAADTGGAIKGNRIDVCVHSRKEAMQWGRKTVKIHVFKGKHTASELE